MPEFSACYFCGMALDAPLAEYPVVPETLHPSADQQRTVVLCPSCRRKLGAVVDAVVGAVDDAPSDASIQQDLEAAGNGGDEDEAAGGIAVEEVDGHRAVEESTDEPRETDDDGFEFEERMDRIDAEAVKTDQGTETRDDTADEEHPASEAAADAADGTTAADERDDGGAPDDEAATSDATAAKDTSATDDRVADGPTDDDAEDNNATDGADEPQLTALEYNKVMRLLQNREFPVALEEFKIVATNAYEISDEEFDAIIEAAANRDLIGLEGGKIVDS